MKSCAVYTAVYDRYRFLNFGGIGPTYGSNRTELLEIGLFDHLTVYK